MPPEEAPPAQDLAPTRSTHRTRRPAAIHNQAIHLIPSADVSRETSPQTPLHALPARKEEGSHPAMLSPVEERHDSSYFSHLPALTTEASVSSTVKTASPDSTEPLPPVVANVPTFRFSTVDSPMVDGDTSPPSSNLELLEPNLLAPSIPHSSPGSSSSSIPPSPLFDDASLWQPPETPYSSVTFLGSETALTSSSDIVSPSTSEGPEQSTHPLFSRASVTSPTRSSASPGPEPTNRTPLSQTTAIHTAPFLPSATALRALNVRGSGGSTFTIPVNPFASTMARDTLLVYAHKLYNHAMSLTSSTPSDLPPPPPPPPTLQFFASPSHGLFTSSHAAPSQFIPQVPIVNPAFSYPFNTPQHIDQYYILREQILPLLHSLVTLHPTYMPILLLLGCVMHAMGDYHGSLRVNAKILMIKPTYVEAMSNIGTTLRALGRPRWSEMWWWKAVRLRPMYWDAVDNLIGALCSPTEGTDDLSSDNPPETVTARMMAVSDPWHEPSAEAVLHRFRLDVISGSAASFIGAAAVLSSSIRYARALEIAEFVERTVHPSRTLHPAPGVGMETVSVTQLFRLQHLIHTMGNIRRLQVAAAKNDPPPTDASSSSSDMNAGATPVFQRPSLPRRRSRSTPPSVHDQIRAIDLVLQSPSPSHALPVYSTRDLIFAVCTAGLLIQVSSNPSMRVNLESVALLLGFPDPLSLFMGVQNGSADLLDLVHAAGGRLVRELLQIGGGVVPLVLLEPERSLGIASIVFRRWGGVVPALCVPNASSNGGMTLARGVNDHVVKQTHQITSTVLLTLARVFQEDPFQVAFTTASSNPSLSLSFTSSVPMDIESHVEVRASFTLVLLLYYLALALHPSPSTMNNLGIVLTSAYPPSGGGVAKDTSLDLSYDTRPIKDGWTLARAYYIYGLKIDPSHPHLLTNLGSLLKDAGSPEMAIRLYAKALVHMPNLDVALANMGNAVKDLGRTLEAVDYYRKALAITPDFPEAIVGLAGALSAICDWRDRGNLQNGFFIDTHGRIAPIGTDVVRKGWMDRLLVICHQQLQSAYVQNIGVVANEGSLDDWLAQIEGFLGYRLSQEKRRGWIRILKPFFFAYDSRLADQINETSFVVRFVDLMTRIVQRRWYLDAYGHVISAFIAAQTSVPFDAPSRYARPRIPATLSLSVPPSVLPFHTFTYPMPSRTARLVAHRNAIQISHQTLSQAWVPPHVYPPPPPPSPRIRIGYVSSDINNHPLSHLMQSAFTMHDPSQFEVFIYTLSPSDGSAYRHRIQAECDNFRDVWNWSVQQIVEQIVQDGIHILINLNGYTKGARNGIFAARPAPLQIGLMGYAGTLAAGWCDYIITDVIASPPDSGGPEVWANHRRNNASAELDWDPESKSDEWMFTERFIYMPHSFFVTDHRQSFGHVDGFPLGTHPASVWLAEEVRRTQMRREIFPDLPDTTFIFANFSQIRTQLYKIDPITFAAWLRILARVPDSILWLLRFPPTGEEHLIQHATVWGGPAIASRIKFTSVAQKEDHVARGRVADIFLDTSECTAHTIAADILWSGTPLLTWPRHRLKMASRVGASIAAATGYGESMIAQTLADYEQRAVNFATSTTYSLQSNPHHPHFGPSTFRRVSGPLIDLRRNLYMNRTHMPLFDTRRWVRNLESGLKEAWVRWLRGVEFEGMVDLNLETGTTTGNNTNGRARAGAVESTAIWVVDSAPLMTPY